MCARKTRPIQLYLFPVPTSVWDRAWKGSWEGVDGLVWPLIHPLEFFIKLYPRALGIQGTRCRRGSTYPVPRAPCLCPFLLY